MALKWADMVLYQFILLSAGKEPRKSCYLRYKDLIETKGFCYILLGKMYRKLCSERSGLVFYSINWLPVQSTKLFEL